MFSYLSFEKIQVKHFQSEILERKVNLTLTDNFVQFTYMMFDQKDMYKCIHCGTILPTQYLPLY